MDEQTRESDAESDDTQGAAAPQGSPTAVVEAVALGMLAVMYAATAAQHVLGGDNGEFATVFALGGVAHPPGYPLYSAWLRAMSWMPGVTPAHGAAFATVVLGVAAVAVLARAARAWGASRVGGLIGALVLGVSSSAWTLSTHAEVFALNALMVALILLVAGPRGPLRGVTRAGVLGVLAGLALSNHHSAVMIAPIGLYGALLGAREAREARDGAWSGAGIALGAGAAGLAVALAAVYGWMMSVAAGVWGEVPWVWGEVTSLGGAVDHFLRADYGTTQLAIAETEPDRAGQVGALVAHMARDLLGLPLVLALVGWASQLRAREDETTSQTGGRRVAALAWAAGLVMCGPVFVALFNLPLEGIAVHILKRFYLLPMVVATVGIAWGVDAMLGALGRVSWFARAREDGSRLGSLVLMASVLTVLALGALSALPVVQEHHRPTVDWYLRNVLSPMPPKSVLLATGDQRLFGLLYLQEAEGVRPDVVTVNPQMMHYAWYRARVEAKLGASLSPPQDGTVDTRRLAAELMQTGRPLFMANVFSSGIVKTFPTYPFGATLRVLPQNSSPPDPYALEALNLDIFERFKVEADRPAEAGTWGANAHQRYGETWLALAQVFARMGDAGRARACRARAAVLLPKGAAVRSR